VGIYRDEKRCILGAVEEEADMGGEEPNCWRDCDFPSECHNSRVERQRAQRLARARLLVDMPSPNPSTDWEGRSEWEDIELEGRVKVELEEQKAANTMHELDFPTDSASGEVVDMIISSERRGQEGEAEMVDVSGTKISKCAEERPVFGALAFEGSTFLIDESLDALDVVEVEFVERKRRKSIQKIHQLTGLMLGNPGVDLEVGSGSPPSSPLKREFGFGGEMEMGGCEVWEDEKEVVGEVSADGVGERDLQMEEFLRARCDFLRSFEEGIEDGGFGDVEVV